MGIVRDIPLLNIARRHSPSWDFGAVVATEIVVMETRTRPVARPGKCLVPQKTCLSFLLLLLLIGSVDTLEADPKGYIVYCPCMGQFGHQAEHLLGALSFAHALNRTLVLPPFIEYPMTDFEPVFAPFGEYFSVEGLQDYHRVVTMEDFFNELAHNVWPANNRTVYCYGPREGGTEAEPSCSPKYGKPFGPFWSRYDVDFAQSVFYGPLHHETAGPMLREWQKKYASWAHYVLAFVGPPSKFPIDHQDTKLHRYLRWSENVEYEADKFLQDKVGKLQRPLLGIFISGGHNWENFCKFILGTEDPKYFGQAQCFAHEPEDAQLTPEMCDPPLEVMIAEVKDKVKRTKSVSVFVASENVTTVLAIADALEKDNILVVQYEPYNLQVELAVLAKADYFLGNCVDPLSGFVTRERRVHRKKLDYWAWKSPDHDEL